MTTCCDCASSSKRNILSIFGCMLVVFSFGNENTFGNMNPYMTSYMRNRSEMSTDVGYKDTLWLQTGKIASASVFMPIMASLELFIPSRLCILIGVWTLSLSTCMTYFSLSHSFVATIFTDGVITSMGRALAYPVTLRMTLKLCPKWRGMLVAFLTSFSGLATFAFNQISTQYINPDNSPPDQIIGENRYFTDPDLLDRVPRVFLILGAILAVVSGVGVLIIKTPDSNEESETKIDSTTPNEGNEGDKQEKMDDEQQIESTKSLSPREVLCTPHFYVAWIMYFGVGFGMDIYGVLYKSYGQTFIKDDHFLALVASFAAVASAVGNIIWGILSDIFSYKPVLLTSVSIFTIFLSTIITTEYTGKAGFFVWICILMLSATGVLVLLPLITMDMFGQKYYSVNYGLIHSAGVAFGILSAILTSQIKNMVGWHGIFLIGSGMPLISFVFAAVMYLKNYDLNEMPPNQKSRFNLNCFKCKE